MDRQTLLPSTHNNISAAGKWYRGMMHVERKMKNEIEDESTRLINTAISTNGSANVVFIFYWLALRSLARSSSVPCQAISCNCVQWPANNNNNNSNNNPQPNQQSVSPIEVHSSVICSWSAQTPHVCSGVGVTMALHRSLTFAPIVRLQQKLNMHTIALSPCKPITILVHIWAGSSYNATKWVNRGLV